MLFILLFLISTLLGLSGQPLIIKWANRHNLFDQANERKLHTGAISSLGGISWFAALLFPLIAMIWFQGFYNLLPLLICMLLLFGTSLWDDIKPLSAFIRLGIQIILGAGLYLAGWQLPLGWLSLPATVFFIMLGINAFNFIDGINGLLGSIALLAFAGFGLLFTLQGQSSWALLSVVAAGSTIGFLWFNFGRKARIFMGDNGSTVIGLLLTIFFLQSVAGIDMAETASVVPGLILISLPILDLIRVVTIRLWQRKSPFHADRQHFQHLFVDQGWSAPEVCRLVIRLKLILLMFCWGFPILELQALFITAGFGGLFWFAYQQSGSTTNSPVPQKVKEKPVLFAKSTKRLRA